MNSGASQRSSWIKDEAYGIVLEQADRPGALLPILHALQDRFGWIHPSATAMIAKALNLSRAEVHGALTFYKDFRSTPPARTVVRLCQAEACQARGARELTKMAKVELGLALGDADPNGTIALEPIYCLGLCASGPAALVDGRPYARLTLDRLRAAVQGAEP